MRVSTLERVIDRCMSQITSIARYIYIRPRNIPTRKLNLDILDSFSVPCSPERLIVHVAPLLVPLLAYIASPLAHVASPFVHLAYVDSVESVATSPELHEDH